MAEFSRIEEAWGFVELTDHEISKLREDVLPKIFNEDRIDLLPFCGLLYFKDKMWIGKVKCFTPCSDLVKALKPGEQDTSSIKFYVIESEHKIMDEMRTRGSLPRLETGVSVFALSLPSLSAYAQSVHQQFATYFVTVYGKIPQEKSLERRLILGLQSKLETAWFGEDGGEHSKDGCSQDFRALWTVKARAFIAVLRNAESLPPHILHNPEYEVREMSLDETLYAVEHWKFASESAKYRFACSHNLGFAVGAFLLGSNSPVSWAFTSWDGAISALQTLPGHRGKGLAKAIIKKLSVKLIGNGIHPFVYVEIIDTSFIPESLFTSLGFHLYKNVRFSWKYPC